MEDALLAADGYNIKGKHYSDYLDVESAAKMYLFQEYIKNMDAGLSSCYFYKDVGEKIVAAPVWDLDSAFGRVTERSGVPMDDPKGMWVQDGLVEENGAGKRTIFALLCQHDDFKIEVKKQWEKYFSSNTEAILQKLDDLYAETQVSLFTDKFKWNKERGLSYSEAYNQMEENIETMKMFIQSRSAFLNDVLLDKNYVQYTNIGKTERFAIVSKIWYNIKQLCN